MTDAQLRARIRELIASDDLPSEEPVVQNAGPRLWQLQAWVAMLDLRRT